MSFLKCAACNNGPVKIFAVASSGAAKSKCMNCGLTSSGEHKREKIKRPEVIYR